MFHFEGLSAGRNACRYYEGCLKARDKAQALYSVPSRETEPPTSRMRAVDFPETRYTKLGEDRIAYQVMGDGPLDLLYVPSMGDSLDMRFEWGPYADFLRRLTSFSRLISFDRRGTGASDSISKQGFAPWEHWMDDARAVLDAVGSERAALLAGSDAGATGILFAAAEPERTSALILFCASPRFLAADDYPGGLTEEVAEQMSAVIVEAHGTKAIVDYSIPSMIGNEAFVRWVGRLTRSALSPRDYGEYVRTLSRLDVREVLPTISVPTLVLHRSDPPPLIPFPVEHGRYIAEHIPNAKFVLVPGTDMTIFTDGEPIVAAIEEFLTGARPVLEPDRVLAAVLFTDIVASTERAAALGDRRWKELLQNHDMLAETIIEQQRGRFVKSTGDGVLATFDGPGRAIRFALAFQEALRPLNLEIRMGLHTGEVELRGADIGGIGVHVAARVLEHASDGELLASAAVPMLVAGSGIEFDDRGEHQLKGVPGEWRLFAVRR